MWRGSTLRSAGFQPAAFSRSIDIYGCLTINRESSKMVGYDGWFITHDGSMVLLYMVTWIPSIYPSHVSIYTKHGGKNKINKGQGMWQKKCHVLVTSQKGRPKGRSAVVKELRKETDLRVDSCFSDLATWRPRYQENPRESQRIQETTGRVEMFFSEHQLGLSENSVPLNPMVDDHYPY